MSRKIISGRRLARLSLLLILSVPVSLMGQNSSGTQNQTANVKTNPTNQPPPSTPPPPSDEQTWGNYIVSSTMELGWRGLSVSGNESKFQSDLNYRAGPRLFDSSFLMRSKDHQDPLFDQLLFNTSGFGGDPQGYARVSIEKSGIYKFEAHLRGLSYFNNLSNYALGQHTANTRMKFEDYHLTLLPENRKLKVYLGYSLDSLSGPGTTTYDYSKDEFQINTRQQSKADNINVGADARIGSVDISFMQGFRRFKDDTTYSVTGRNLGNNTTNSTVINTLTRFLPARGHHSFTRFSAHTDLGKKLFVTGRFNYTGSTTDYSLFERLTGVNADPSGVIDTSTAAGTAKRPYGVGEIGLTWLATDKLRISNTFRIDQFNISGTTPLSDFIQKTSSIGAPLPPVSTFELFQRTTKYRRFMNTVEGDYQFNRNYSVHAGYRYTDRHTRLFSSDDPSSATTEIFDNTTNSVIFGVKARPMPNWTIYFDGEHGTADSVFSRLENGRYTNLRGRTQVTVNEKLSFTASFVIRNNTNPTEVFLGDTQLPPGTAPNALDVNIRSRMFSSTVDWAPSPKFWVNGGYTYLHNTSDAGIILFVDKVSQFAQSQYFMRESFFFADVFAQPLSRLTLFASYRINRDPGQGDRISSSVIDIIGSYPLTFQTPEVRATVKLNDRLDWNVGYQFYNYRDWFTPTQNYHAHLPYTSLRIYFGGPRDHGPQNH